MHKRTILLAAATIFAIELIAPPIWAQNTVETIAGGGPNNLPASKSSMGYPAALAIDGAGDVYMADLYSERVFRVDTAGTVTVVAGNGAHAGAYGDGGLAINANVSYPSGVAVDSGGNIFIADRSNCRIRRVSAQTGIISTVAGTNSCWYSGDGGPATSATLNDPSDVAVDSAGNIFIADTNNCLVRKVSASSGFISTLAGTLPDVTGLLHCGYSGDGGPAVGAKLGFPNGLVLDGSGNIIIADTTNCAIRKISASAGTISTVGGTGSCGFSGDGGMATSAQLNQTYGVAVDRIGNILIADTINCLVREISTATARISTVAGNYSSGCGFSGDGTSAINAKLNRPYAVTADSSGNIYIADYNNSVVRKVSAATGVISTFAGVTIPYPNRAGELVGLPAYSGDGYQAKNAEIGFLNATPWAASMATDRSGNVFIADTANNAVREISASTGIITTVAGNGIVGYSGDGGPATSAGLFAPRDVAVDGSGNIYIMDSGNCVVRKVTASTGVISTVAGTLPDSLGNYHCDFSGDGGPATSAELYPIDLLVPAGGVAVDNAGNIFIADTGNGVIRKVSASTGIITTVAGIANSVDVGIGDGGPATSAGLFAPYGVAVDNVGNIFIADTHDFAIREVMAVNGNIYTVAGNIALGLGFSGDDGPAGLGQLRNVYDLFIDPAGNLFVPDPDNCVVRKVSASTGNISTVAGTPNRNGDYFCGYAGDGGPALSAIFIAPSAAGADTSGSLVVLDNTRVRTVEDLVESPAAAAVPIPNPLAFPIEPLGTSNILTVVLSNRGSLLTSVSKVAISGTNASDFSETDNCAGHSLAAGGGACALNVKFTASVVGTETALLVITDTAGVQTVSLSGAGQPPPGFSPSVTTLPFGPQQKGVRSLAKSVTVTNSGNSSLTISTVGVSGANASDFTITGNSCSVGAVAVNGTCVVSVTFAPSTVADEIASLKFTDNAPLSPQTIGLTGTGTDFSIGLAPGGSATATVKAGVPTTYSLQMTPISAFTGTVALSCTGAPQSSTCTPSTGSVTADGNNAVTFLVQVSTRARSIATPGISQNWRAFDGLHFLPTAFIISVASVLVFAVRFRRVEAKNRSIHIFAIPVGYLILAIILIGCGGGASGDPTPPSGGTPTGSYVLTVTGTSNGVSHSQTLTLTVN